MNKNNNIPKCELKIQPFILFQKTENLCKMQTNAEFGFKRLNVVTLAPVHADCHSYHTDQKLNVVTLASVHTD